MQIEDAIAIARAGSTPEPNTGCWLWLGSIAGRNYAVIYRNRRMIYVCRAILGLTDRRIEALHRCDVSCCVNPEHLFVGTQQDNITDMIQKGRQANAAKTHCKNGHPFNIRNARPYKRDGRDDRRICRTCEYESKKKRRARARAHLTLEGCNSCPVSM